MNSYVHQAQNQRNLERFQELEKRIKVLEELVNKPVETTNEQPICQCCQTNNATEGRDHLNNAIYCKNCDDYLEHIAS